MPRRKPTPSVRTRQPSRPTKPSPRPSAEGQPTAAHAREPKEQRARVRLAPDERRRQIVDVAAAMLAELGAERVEILAVARRAGVTRPVIYRFFPTRLALVEAVLDDFEAELSARFHEALVRSVSKPLLEVVESFINACCDAIQAKGKGAWHLMYARSSDSEAARLGRAAHARLLAPWFERVAEMTALSPSRSTLFGEMFVAAGRAALDGWLDGSIRRAEAVRLATRAVGALLREFSSGAS